MEERLKDIEATLRDLQRQVNLLVMDVNRLEGQYEFECMYESKHLTSRTMDENFVSDVQIMRHYQKDYYEPPGEGTKVAEYEAAVDFRLARRLARLEKEECYRAGCTPGWQQCPKCAGSGELYALISTSVWGTSTASCDVCRGKKIISVSTGQPPN